MYALSMTNWDAAAPSGCRFFFNCTDAPSSSPLTSCAELPGRSSTYAQANQSTLYFYPSVGGATANGIGYSVCDIRTNAACGSQPVSLSLALRAVPTPVEFRPGGPQWVASTLTPDTPLLSVRYNRTAGGYAMLTTLMSPIFGGGSSICAVQYNASGNALLQCVCALNSYNVEPEYTVPEADGMVTALFFTPQQFSTWVSPPVNMTGTLTD